MGLKRKQHSAEFKARVAMAALSGKETLAELSAEFGVHPTIISGWKQELVKRAGELFARGSKAPAADDTQKVIDDLHRKIGQLQVEYDFLAGQPPVADVLSLAVFGLAAGIAPATVSAQGLVTTDRISAAVASQLVAGAFAACKEQTYNVTAVVLDIDGVRQAMLRGDGAGIATLEKQIMLAKMIISGFLSKVHRQTLPPAAQSPPASLPD